MTVAAEALDQGARVMKGGGWGELYTVRDLRRETVRVPEVVSRIVS